ncbi:putative L-asparaginase periplasmic [Oratosquilla oratoria]|uniref:putative L-asparaginase periplasmic n=1 Tax=Oratosquilla oratoria TaxID=337810 RepID=UPI003F7747D8
MNEILVLQTGGTIDKDYPKAKGGYGFEIGNPASKRVLMKLKPARSILTKFETVCRKDSQDLTEEDRNRLLDTILNSPQKKIVVTHGTDSLVETAQFLARSLLETAPGLEKAIILIGAMTPERFKDSDADFNLGVAIGAVQVMKSGVWVAMNGLLLPWDRADRDDVGQFVPRRKSLSITI